MVVMMTTRLLVMIGYSRGDRMYGVVAKYVFEGKYR
jgi:hypothetical protein